MAREVYDLRVLERRNPSTEFSRIAALLHKQVDARARRFEDSRLLGLVVEFFHAAGGRRHECYAKLVRVKLPNNGLSDPASRCESEQLVLGEKSAIVRQQLPRRVQNGPLIPIRLRPRPNLEDERRKRAPAEISEPALRTIEPAVEFTS
jgi:hypothetical protein